MNRPATILALLALAALGAAFPATAQDAMQPYLRSKAAKESGDLDLALREIKAGVRAFPHDDGLIDWQSWIEYLMGDYDNGLAHARQATRIRPTSTDHVFLLGLNAEGAGDFDLARDAFRYVVGQGAGDPHYADARAHLDGLTAKDYTVTWNIDPSKVRLVEGAVLVPYPPSDSAQTCTLSVRGAASFAEKEVGGNRALAIVPDGRRHFSLVLNAQVRPYSYRATLTKYDARATVPNAVRPFLGESERIDPTSAAVRQVMSQIQPAQTTVGRVRSVQAWLKKNYTYEFTSGNYRSVDQLLSTHRAECNGYSSTAAALLRASGVPARVVWVLVKSPGVAPPDHLKGHVVAEYWLPGPNCWVPFEPQQSDPAGVRDNIRMCFQSPGMPWLSSALMQADGDMPAYTEKAAPTMSIR